MGRERFTNLPHGQRPKTAAHRKERTQTARLAHPAKINAPSAPNVLNKKR